MRIITLGSSLGGSGKSFMAANLGVALAQRGVRTCVVDLDLATASLHLLLGMFEPVRGLPAFLRGDVATLDEAAMPVPEYDGLSLVPGAAETMRGFSDEEVSRLIEGLARLPADVVLVDLAAGIAPQELDIFVSGDEQWLLTRADHRSVESAAGFLRLARLRRVARGHAVQPPNRPKIYSSLDALVKDMTEMRRDEITLDRGRGVRPGLVLTCCTEELDAETPGLLTPVANVLGEPHMVIEIPHDVYVDRSIASLVPLVADASGSPAARCIADLAARIASHDGQDEPVPTTSLETALF